jgi:hypothetical protein
MVMLCRNALQVFLNCMRQSIGPNQSEAKLIEVQINYFLFASIPDVRRLVDDHIRKLLFVEMGNEATDLLNFSLDDEDDNEDYTSS